MRQPGEPGQLPRAGPVPDQPDHHRDRARYLGVLRADRPVQPGAHRRRPSANTSSCFPVYWQQFTPADRRTGSSSTPCQSVTWPTRPAARRACTPPTATRRGVALRRQRAGAAQVPHLRAVARLSGRQDLHRHRHRRADRVRDHLLPGHVGRQQTRGTVGHPAPTPRAAQHADTDQLAGDVLETTDYDYAGGPVEDSTIYSYWVSAAGGDPDPVRAARADRQRHRPGGGVDPAGDHRHRHHHLAGHRDRHQLRRHARRTRSSACRCIVFATGTCPSRRSRPAPRTTYAPAEHRREPGRAARRDRDRRRGLRRVQPRRVQRPRLAGRSTR